MFNWLRQFFKPRWVRSGPLLPYIEEFRRTCIDWKRDRISSEDAHEIFLRLHKDVFRRAFWTKEIQSQAAYDFYNLAAEMANATSFENQDKSVATIGLKLVEDHLGAVYFNRLWPKLVEKRGPIAGFYLYKCLACRRIAPHAGSAEFVDLAYMICMKCGDLFEYSTWDVELGEAASKRQALTYKASYGEIKFLDCKCGGDLLTVGQLHRPCVYCGEQGTVSKVRKLSDIGKVQLTDYPEYIPMSSYQYLQTHRIHKLYDFIERPIRPARLDVESDYELGVARLCASLASELGRMKEILKKHGVTKLADEVEASRTALWEDHKAGIAAVLRMFADPSTLGVFAFGKDNVLNDDKGSVHDLNNEFRHMRSNIYRIAVKASQELRKWEHSEAVKPTPVDPNPPDHPE